MKKIISVLVCIFLLACSKEENRKIPIIKENITLSQPESYEYDLQWSGDESGYDISKQAKNFEISEIERIDDNLDETYTYKAKAGFVGSDFVEISLRTYNIGSNNSFISKIIRINFEVQK